MIKKMFFVLLLFLLSGCMSAPVVHDASKAVEDANKVLKMLYFRHDYDGARKEFDSEFTFFHSSGNPP